MPLRKKVKHILSKLGLHHSKSAQSTTTLDLNPPAHPAGANIYSSPDRPSPPGAPTPPLMTKISLPRAANSGSLSSCMGVKPDEPSPYLARGESSGFEGSAAGTATRKDGYILTHPGEETGPRFIRDLDAGTGRFRDENHLRPNIDRGDSEATGGTSVSSNYDEHSITHSLYSTPVPSSGVALIESHNRFSDPAMPPFPPSGRLSPILTEGHRKTLLSSPASPASTDITHTLAPSVVHTTIRPERRENEHTIHTIEHHYRYIQPTIQPIVERQSLPPKFYLKTAPDQMHEISAQEAQQYGDPVWIGDTVVPHDANHPVQDTIRTRLPTPHGSGVTGAEPLLPEEPYRDVYRDAREEQDTITSMNLDFGESVNRRGSPSIASVDTFGRAGAGRSGAR